MEAKWIPLALEKDVPANGGACVKVGEKQIAIFNFASKNKWYACQNQCSHTNAMVLSRGIIGDANGVAKVACPMHKRNFSLESGENLEKNCRSLKTYPIKIVSGRIYLDESKI